MVEWSFWVGSLCCARCTTSHVLEEFHLILPHLLPGNSEVFAVVQVLLAACHAAVDALAADGLEHRPGEAARRGAAESTVELLRGGLEIEDGLGQEVHVFPGFVGEAGDEA